MGINGHMNITSVWASASSNKRRFEKVVYGYAVIQALSKSNRINRMESHICHWQITVIAVKPRTFGLALLKNLAYWEKAKWRVAKCKEAKRKAAYPSSVPIPEPTTTSLRKCIPDTTREIATFAARTISTGISSG